MSVPVVALLALLGASSAMGAGDGAHGEDGHAMELMWQAVNLAILIAVLFFVGRKPVQAFFAERRKQIGTDLDDAAALLAQAERRYADWQRKLIDLDADVVRIRTESRARAEEDREAILAEAQAAAERIHKNAVATVEQELRRAQAELRREAAVIATELAERILREKLEDSDRDRLLDEFITRVEPSSPGAR
jgi:F-type H+-transporting ATPase subunit b